MDQENEIYRLSSHYDVVILAAGDYPTTPALLQLLSRHPRVICCDGAADAFMRHHHHLPWRVVGDLDSLSPELRHALPTASHPSPSSPQPASGLAPRHESRLIHVAEQETNDLSKAVSYAEAHGYRTIAILGATGRREDHTLGNIALLVDYLRRGLHPVMLTDYGTFVACSNRWQALLPIGMQLSIFNFGATAFEAQGLRYPLYDFSTWWQGTLNATTAPQVCIAAHGEFLVYVCHNHLHTSNS